MSDEFMVLLFIGMEYIEMEYMMLLYLALKGVLMGFVLLGSGTLICQQTVVRVEGAQNCSIHKFTQLYYTM